MAKTKTAENARLDMEQGQTFYPMAELVDSGDQTTYAHATALLFSGKEAFTPQIIPNGLATGGVVTPGTADDTIDVAALSCYLIGILTAVTAAAATSVSRGAVLAFRINSITVNAAGAIIVVTGTEGATSSEVRGAAGGPPLIPVDSVEVAQVRLSSITAAAVTTQEIFSVVGQHTERFDSPPWNEVPESASITFIAALPKIHTGSLPKKVFSEVYSPIFSQISLASDFVAPEKTHSVASTQIYGDTIGAVSSTLGQGSFTSYLKDGVTDPVVKEKDNTLWFKFWPDKFKTPYILSQGKLGVARTFPAADSILANCTVSSNSAAQEKAA